MIPAGNLQHIVAIERAQRLKTGAAGSVATTWIVHATTRAELVERVASDEQKPAGVSVRERLTFRIRWRDDVTTADRIVFDGRPHNIKSIVEIGRRVGLEIICGVTNGNA